jgi:protein O-GlcNAcase/histone acetyltransferase
LFTRLTYINNRELLYELYPYVWDMRGVVALLNSYVKWLGEL